jgi:hypothetical protein
MFYAASCINMTQHAKICGENGISCTNRFFGEISESLPGNYYGINPVLHLAKPNQGICIHELK